MIQEHSARMLHHAVMSVVLRHLAEAQRRREACLTPIGKAEAQAQVRALSELCCELEGLGE